MTIGIVGAGSIGSAIAAVLARAGLPAQIVNRRGPQAMGPLLAGLAPTVTPGSLSEVLGADIVFVAVPWGQLGNVLGGLTEWGGRIVVDCNNALEGPSFRGIKLGGRTSSEVFADMVPGARVVKGFNHMLPHLLAGDPSAEGGRRVLFLAGDDADAKAEVGTIIDAIGCYRVDLGGLRDGGRLFQFPDGPLPGLNFVVFE